jgi:hypothetical protein
MKYYKYDIFIIIYELIEVCMLANWEEDKMSGIYRDTHMVS